MSQDAVDNPFAAPSDRSRKAHSSHQEFSISGARIICRSGLTLPDICLVTQEVDHLKSLPLRLAVPSSTGHWIAIVGLGGVVCGVIIIVMFFLLERGSSGVSSLLLNMKWLLTGFALLLLGLLAQAVSTLLTLLRPAAFVAASVTGDVEKAIKRQNVTMSVMSVLVVASLAVLGPVVEGRGPLFMLAVCLPAVLVFPTTAFAINRRFHQRNPGLRIRARSERDGVFQIEGFASPYLAALEQYKSELSEAESDEQRHS